METIGRAGGLGGVGGREVRGCSRIRISFEEGLWDLGYIEPAVSFLVRTSHHKVLQDKILHMDPALDSGFRV